MDPIIVLTKADQCDDVEAKRHQVQALDSLMLVHAINALDPIHLQELEGYCQHGKTLVLLGSSGVGKSTLVNGLMGFETQQTAAVREDDSKGRHTTTFRSLKWLPQGGVLMDTSGVGKSTLVNGLMGFETQQTAAVREDDSKGRHTTTFRSLKWLPQGGVLMDTSGMRELQLSACE